MALTFKLAVTQNDVDEARSSGRYNGPTPPPGVYHVELKKLWASENRQGDCLKALLSIKETGDLAAYNGYGIFYTMTLPMDSSHQYFSMQIRSLDEFMKAISKGEMDFNDFAAASNAGKILNGEDENSGTPITQIGKLKIKPVEFDVKTKNSESDDKVYVNVSYIKDVPTANKTASSAAPVEDDDDIDFGDDDLEGLLDD